MNALRILIHEVFRLFVDDGSLAVALLVWLGISFLLARLSEFEGPILGMIWFAGCAGILIENVLRRARRE